MAATYTCYTLQTLVDAITHALTGSPNPLTPAVDIVNRAIGFLVAEHDWTWRRKLTFLSFVANQSYITLPEDFGELISLKAAPNSFREVVPTSLDDILERRQFNYGSSYELYYAITYAPQASASALPTCRLELFPTPGANLASALSFAYLRQLPLLVNLTDVPDMPGDFHPLLLLLCRAMAISSEEDRIGEDWAEYARLLPGYQAKDGKTIGNSAGQMCSTLRRMRRVSRFFPNGRITA